MTLYTSKVIAQWLCLTERRVRQLRDEGVIVEARPGLYELQPTVARYIKYLGGAGKESLNTERMKLTAEKRKAAEMDNDLRRGNLHSTQDIEKGIALWCHKAGKEPYGNNNYGKDTRESLYRAIPTSKDNDKTGRVATGTGPVTWSHDGTLEGIWDLNGNVWEWCAGLRLATAGKHPYHLVHTDGTSTVYGWVDAAAITGKASATPAVKTYTVKAGDSLWRIAAQQLGNGARYKEIKTLNGLKNNTIHAGQVLKLPN